MGAVSAAIIAALTSVFVVLLTKWFERKTEKQKKSELVNKELLNPLRLYLEECYFRTSEILSRLEANDNKCNDLLYVVDPKDLSAKDPSWFIGEGCYLISSCYFAACMFSCAWKVRAETPYLRLAGADDSQLLNSILTISRAFSRDLGVFYEVQHVIGQSMLEGGGGRVRSYREFCAILGKDQERLWFDSLIQLYINLGMGQGVDRARAILNAILQTSRFVDGVAGSGPSVSARLAAEKAPLPSHESSESAWWMRRRAGPRT